MKKGDVVTIRDGSYTKSVVNGELIHEHLAIQSKQYKVVETGCSFPAKGNQAYDSDGYCGPSFNNTVIQAVDSGKVVFIEERFLRLAKPTHKVMIDVRQDGGWTYGQIVEISDELYKQIKTSGE